MVTKSMPEPKITHKQETLGAGSIWLLNTNINGYKNIKSNELATEVISGRFFLIIENPSIELNSLKHRRIKVRLLEDGYICWFNLKEITNHVQRIQYWKPILHKKIQIKKKLPKVLGWIEEASKCPNDYLWGGTLGPNFDCSGLIQYAFSKEGIWIPRDAYQQEEFCTKIQFDINTLNGISAGDLVFFGNSKKCTHVGMYKGNGDYWHSSGTKNGRNGIGIDNLKPNRNNSISSYYSSMLRGAGRIESCYNEKSISSIVQ
ncbi:C40 family peptidase [Prochlorococcus sp. MIT 0602]|uniref:C40 family peptidase n=2 Tax=Prochlorococcus TaxID=1218 RepID=UPI00053381E6|nr:C40 family peptidase [Prochlorococcus sp. MIT 0602]KGG14715.1 hypothetical protein EV06_1775 [Prochlorococcus sp. MIT 0602]